MRFLENKHSYESVYSNEDEVELPRTQTKQTNFSRITIIVCIVVAQILALTSASIAAYTFGRLRAEEASTATIRRIGNSEIRTQSTVLEYNRTYAERPSPETDAAWEAIFPPHGGFFHDKKLAPNGASLAVYHQLHCLDAIRHAYYVLLDAVNEGHNVTFSELEDYSTDWHTRHCLDFLRQMLMCNADLNLERVDLNLGGIRGFGDGREHQCVVWEDVRNWSIEHQVQS